MKKYALKEKEGKQQCQKCLQFGHWTYECMNEPVYLYRPSRTQLFKNKQYSIPLVINEEPPEKIKVKGPEFNSLNSNLNDNNSKSISNSFSYSSSSNNSNDRDNDDSSFSSSSISSDDNKGKMNSFFNMIQNLKKDKDKALRKEKLDRDMKRIRNRSNSKNKYERRKKTFSRSRSRSIENEKIYHRKNKRK